MLGEWVDGMVFDGSSIWVAETGQSSLAQLNATYGVARRVKLAGVPRKIDIGSDRAIYALIESDDQTRLWQQLPGSAAGKVIAGLELRNASPCRPRYRLGTEAHSQAVLQSGREGASRAKRSLPCHPGQSNAACSCPYRYRWCGRLQHLSSGTWRCLLVLLGPRRL
jgi:hypothetical protein